MLLIFIVIIVILMIIVWWIISTQRRIIIIDENINNLMNQIGLQLSNCFDALMALLELTKGYAKYESEELIETVKARRNVITAKSTTDEVQYQEEVISEVLIKIAVVTEQYPQLKEDENYIKIMNAIITFENMVHNSRFIYNDNVTKLNREIRIFPVSIIARLFGCNRREYLGGNSSTVNLKRLNKVKEA